MDTLIWSLQWTSTNFQTLRHSIPLQGSDGPGCPQQSPIPLPNASSSAGWSSSPFSTARVGQVTGRPWGSPDHSSQAPSCTEQFVYGWQWEVNCSVLSFSLMGWVERFGCQTGVRPRFSSLPHRVPLAAANTWLWVICQGWLYNGNGEMDCQLQLVFSDCLADEGLSAGLTALEHSGFSLRGKEPILNWVLKMKKGSRWLIFVFTCWRLSWPSWQAP